MDELELALRLIAGVLLILANGLFVAIEFELVWRTSAVTAEEGALDVELSRDSARSSSLSQRPRHP